MPSYPITYPTNKALSPKKIDFTTRTLGTQFRSPYTGLMQTHRYGGQWFELNVTLPPLFQSDAEELTGFLNALGGMQGIFYFQLPSKFLIPSTVVATTTTTGNDFTVTNGATINVGKYGYTSNITPNRLVQFTTATSLFPKLNPSQAGYSINNSAGAKMRLASNDLSYSVDEMMITGVVIPMVEAMV